jgi:hypothetical protein
MAPTVTESWLFSHHWNVASKDLSRSLKIVADPNRLDGVFRVQQLTAAHRAISTQEYFVEDITFS